ncbi:MULTISPECIES: hypothetical protein [unclassified Wolbachia]|uniref:hypothetical protein n=1 Tax=unclassified Wolbachia TaxID=2640676 RepID=UPI00223281DC|nr:hypothetical protein [Wolbachia endosymbiont (group B) of Athalia cordata]
MKQKAPTEYAKTQCYIQCYNYRDGYTDQYYRCVDECIQRHSSEVFKPHSQVSEKLAASAKSLYDESEKLLLIAEEIYNQDPMNF